MADAGQLLTHTVRRWPRTTANETQSGWTLILTRRPGLYYVFHVRRPRCN